MNAIEVSNVSKVYRRFNHRRQFATLKSAIITGSLIGELRPDETFRALEDVSFTVPAGRTFGIIGRNGSGKSTMLKCVAGISRPTSGSVVVRGRISALIELGAGFHPEISGRENVFINGIMLGLSRAEVARRFDAIVRFAELESFIDAPVKTYSSGMYMRLGFAVAINVDPDVLLIDEVLAVGDEGFTHKCLDKFGEFRRRGKTILLVTHGLGMVERFCDEALWLDRGRVCGAGDPKRVVDAYVTEVETSEEAHLAAEDAVTREVAGGSDASTDASRVRASVERNPPGAVPPTDMFRATEGRWGTREVEVEDVTLVGEDGQAAHVFHSGDRVTLRLSVHARDAVRDFAFGVAIFNADGVCCYGTNTSIEELQPEVVRGRGEVRFVIDRLDLTEGTYKLDVAAHKLDGYPYDYHRQLYTFRVKSRLKDVGIYRPPHTWEFSENVRLRRVAGPVGWEHSR
ncbi:MAG: ATP-binding cassette domain-containing protein [Luteitalea sp.]|nr:ATP-binding cassette domain-containing protein [Luteitalea sp.]